MSADKFQQQVSHKMDELRLQPNPQVWVDVERRIREKKRRRVLVIWFLFAGLLLGGGTFLLLNQQGNKNETASVAVKKTNPKNETNKQEGLKIENPKKENVVTTTNENTTKPGSTIVEKANPKNEKEIIAIKERKTKPAHTTEVSTSSVPVVVKQKTEPNSLKSTAAKEKDLSAEVIAETKPAEVKKEKDGSIASNTIVEVDKQTQTSKPDNTIASVPPAKTTDDMPADIKNDAVDSAKNNITNAEPVNESKKDADKKPAKKNKWEWGLNLAIGNTRLTEGNFLDLNMNKSADMFSAPQSGSNTPPPPVSYADSIPLNGPYWNIGLSAKKQLGKKTSFTTGLNLAVYTTKQRVGNFVDSIYPINNDIRSFTYSGFYTAGQTRTFKNHYYFIQVPLLFNWQLNKGEKLPPITWENGFLPSFLISSDALAYDKQSRRFYKDKRLYTDVQLIYHTALTAGIFKDSKHPLTVGVFYNFNMSMLQKVSQPNYNYLNSFGLKLNWVIKK